MKSYKTRFPFEHTRHTSEQEDRLSEIEPGDVLNGSVVAAITHLTRRWCVITLERMGEKSLIYETGMLNKRWGTLQDVKRAPTHIGAAKNHRRLYAKHHLPRHEEPNAHR